MQAVILSSFYESTPEPGPNSKPDYGYEVTNHTVIDTVYGNMNDFVELLDAAHELGWWYDAVVTSFYVEPVIYMYVWRTLTKLHLTCMSALAYS